MNIEQKKIINNAIEYVKYFFTENTNGHDYYHMLRVYNTATIIAKEEKANIFIVQLASLLHDVDDFKLFPHTYEHKDNAINFLKKNNVSASDISIIYDIINSVSFVGTDSIVPSTIEGKCVQDADRLDALGAIGIARVFSYGGSHNRMLYDPKVPYKPNMNKEEYMKNNSTSINHFYEKLFLLKDMLNTKTAKLIAEHRDAYMHQFVDEFFSEWNGML